MTTAIGLRLVFGAIVICGLSISPVAFGEILMEEHDGVLYVKNVEPAVPIPAAASSPANLAGPAGSAGLEAAAGELTIGRPAAPYGELIRQAAMRHAVAPDLIESVIRVESNFEPRAMSLRGRAV
jgi:soluble lytic murein transglycosylase-like protein